MLAAARTHPPSDHVPYAFEKRVLALLASRPLPDAWTLWASALWRAAVPCVAVAILLGVWTFLAPNRPAPEENFSLDFEQTMLAAVNAVE